MTKRLDDPLACPVQDCSEDGLDWPPAISRHAGTHDVSYEAFLEAARAGQTLPPSLPDGHEENPGTRTITNSDVRDLVEPLVTDALEDHAHQLTKYELHQVVGKVVDEKINEDRRRTLESMGMTMLEGPLRFREDDAGRPRARVDHHAISDLMHHYLEDGEHVRVLVQVIDPDEEYENADKSRQLRSCVHCGSEGAPGGLCEACEEEPVYA